MSNRFSATSCRRFASLSLGLLLGLILFSETPEMSSAQETKAGASSAERPAGRRSRLPPYYGRVATVDQRAALDKIQATYAPKIEKLREELDKLLAARDVELRAALGADQQKQLDELVAAARERRRNRAARGTTAATATSATDGASATRTVKPAERAPAKP